MSWMGIEPTIFIIHNEIHTSKLVGVASVVVRVSASWS